MPFGRLREKAASAEKDAEEWQRNANAGELRCRCLKWFVYSADAVVFANQCGVQDQITDSSRMCTFVLAWAGIPSALGLRGYRRVRVYS